MAQELGAFFISIIPSAKGLTGKVAKEFAGIDREASKSGKTSGAAFSDAFKGALSGVAAALSVGAMTSFVGSAVDGAGKLEQSMGAIDSVFKGSSKQMQDWSKDAAKNVGLSQNEFNELGTLIGAQLKNGGTAMDDLAPKTNSLIGMGADLSSMFGGTTKEAIEAMSSALRGESDPIERYGVSLTAARIEAKALEQGATKVNGELSQQAKQAAILALITEQTADAQGNFARESDTFAQKQQVMSAKWEDLKTKIGEQFMPALTAAFGYITDTALPKLEEFGAYINDTIVPRFKDFSKWIVDNKDQLIVIAGIITAVMLPALVRLGIGALVSGAQQVAGWAMSTGGAIRAGIVYVAQSILIVARWAAMSVAATINGAKIAAVWAAQMIGSAVKGAAAFAVQAARVAASWVVMSAAAVVSGAKTAAVWTGTVVAQAASGAAKFAVQAGRVVGAWLLMSVQSLFHAGRMALAWFIALGPIGWVIAAVLGLVAVVIANWDKISAFTRDMWEKHVKPVFDKLSSFITKDVPKAFENGVKWIGEAWAKLQDLAKKPVKFVIESVINDGLINGLNGIGGFLGLPKIPRLALPAGFADGGYTGPGHKYKPAGIVHAGEYVFTKEQTRRAGVGNLAALAGSLSGYARGGFVNPLKQMALTQGYNRVHKGIDLAAGVGTPVFATQNGVVSHAGPGARAPGVWGGNEIHVLGNGIETWFAHLSQIGVKLGQNVRAGQQIGLSGNTGISTGPHLHFGVFQGGWPNDIDPLSYLGGAGVPDGKPWNPIADIVGGLVDQFKKAFPAAGFIADLAIGAGKKILDGAVAFVTGQSGKDKGSATATLYDGGGWLENTGGAQLVQHNKRKPDAVLSSSQWDTMTRIADNAKGGFNNYGTINVRDEEEAARIILTRQRDAQAAYGF